MSENFDNNKLKFSYVIPNLFTAGSAFVGVLSIIATSQEQFFKAAVFIFLSLILDGLDGRVARLTNTTSKFGVEFDSLADVIAFGVAPAMLFYFSFGYGFGRVGVLFVALYIVFGAIRLARFNVMSPISEPSVFIGVPIPMAAIFVTMWVLVFLKYPDILNKYFLIFIVALTSVLMVSNIRYPSFKKLNTKKSNTIKILILLVIVFSLIYLKPVETLTVLTSSYVFYGIARYIYNIFIVKFKKKKV